MVTPKFVVTNNENDGTMTRFDFPNDDYTQAPTVTVFASGGFRGDLTQVGSDGCIYSTQGPMWRSYRRGVCLATGRRAATSA